MASLGVNIDHIANIRQARRTVEPDPVPFAMFAELGGADGITVGKCIFCVHSTSINLKF